ncbi:MAG: histone deacetylase [Saprospiraceae bacterium]|nr:histone deacetylase [Saprospiraceae bacterium]
MVSIAYSSRYKYELPDGHRFPMDKYELLPEQLLYEGTISAGQLFEPSRLSRDIVLRTHTESYFYALMHDHLSGKEKRKIGFPVRKELVERGLHIAQGTLTCALRALHGGIGLNIAGGTHHAYADHGEGFCVFNDFAIAANQLLFEGLCKQILIVDLDVHQGNGTARIFEGRSQVFTFSMHGAKNYPAKKEKSDLDIALNDRTGDHLYLDILDSVIPKLIKEVKPDIIFYLAGADVLESDALGRLSLSKAGTKQRDRIILENCIKHDIPVAVCMGGGYSPKIRDVVDVHANTFRVAVNLYT